MVNGCLGIKLKVGQLVILNWESDFSFFDYLNKGSVINM
jgi:hypothetical protein